MKLADKVAIVTGAASGMGKSIALAFVREGAKVVGVDCVADRLAQVEKEGEGKIATWVTDLSDATQVEAMVAGVMERFGRVDILVNVAGIATQSPLAQMPVSMWDEMMSVNLRSVFLCTRFVLPHMLQNKFGRIINVSSQLGYKGAPELTHYCAAKGGVIAFTKALAREVAPHILVNGIAPGPVETQLLAGLSDEWRAMKAAELPLGRFGRVDEIVPTAVFLASEDSTYYTGQILGPNGGDVML
ncbi:SDR family NAD(P)-dependent oxidoreductase [Thermicanus aegyptius]|uniref:SDR family NAD(P)-dependent oxidoreductase n=1 Tax=Thermicanus aegyptius TaxID=94009 RepID=UPI000406B435|nr:3-oxoacyl-ACP reductase family protein [Thermicanus aegyptius]